MGSINLPQVTLVAICGNEKFLNGTIMAANICKKNINFAAVKILSNISTNIDDIDVIKIKELDREAYSRFSMYELYKYIDTEYCLTFQWDGFIINPRLWLDKFLDYDYIGAPWLNEKYNNVGNGGFSLRSQKFLQSAKTLDYNSDIQFQPHIPAGKLITPEDWFVCNYHYHDMINMGVKFADINTAYEFSVEHPSINKFYNRRDLKTYRSFGFHGNFNIAAMELLK